jgi:hypothetical protein
VGRGDPRGEAAARRAGARRRRGEGFEPRAITGPFPTAAILVGGDESVAADEFLGLGERAVGALGTAGSAEDAAMVREALGAGEWAPCAEALHRGRPTAHDFLRLFGGEQRLPMKGEAGGETEGGRTAIRDG